MGIGWLKYRVVLPLRWLLSGLEALITTCWEQIRQRGLRSLIIMYVRLRRRPNGFTNQWAETLSLKRPADQTCNKTICLTRGKESNNGSVRLGREPIVTSQWLKDCRDDDWTRHVTVVDYQTEKCNNSTSFKSIKELAVPNFNPAAQKSLFRNCTAWQKCDNSVLRQHNSTTRIKCVCIVLSQISRSPQALAHLMLFTSYY